MYSIKYSSKSYKDIDNFINSYKNIFKKLYNDTGIDNEDIIIQNYVNVSNKLYSNIKNKIESIFKEDILLWKRESSDNDIYIIASIDRLRMFIYFSEDNNEKIRFIEEIEFFKK